MKNRQVDENNTNNMSIEQLRFVQQTSNEMRQQDFEIISKLNLMNGEKMLVDEGSVYLENNNTLVVSRVFSPVLNGQQTLCASIRFNNSIQSTGWDTVYLKTYSPCPPLVQYWAAGYLEGLLTHHQIKDFYTNLVGLHQQEQRSLQNVFDAFEQVENNIRHKTTNNYLSSLDKVCEHVYWSNLALHQAQVDGLLLGYNAMNTYQLTVHDIYLINSDGQVSELLQIFKNRKKNSQLFRLKQQNGPLPQQKLNVKELLKKYKVKTGDELFLRKLMKSHCSAFVKLVLENKKIKDLLIGHSTWDDYSEMLRVYKHYDLGLLGTRKEESGLGEYQVTFSSYPGCLSSTDDWYTINGQLVVTETTLEVMQEGLYRNIVEAKHYVPDFMRVLGANRMARDTLGWVFWLSYYNTGTYNSQWMLVDLHRVQQSLGGGLLQSNSFVVMEQMPGDNNIDFADMSHYLTDHQYWASYNVPFFDNIREVSGYSELMKGWGSGDSFSWERNPRANIFRFYAPQVQRLEDLQWLMRLNQFDSAQPLFNGSVPRPRVTYYDQNPGNAISARFDLSPTLLFKKNVGAIDSKVTSLALALNMQTLAISGPTAQNQKPFQWNTAAGNDPHAGLPDKYVFPWLLFDPLTIYGQQTLYSS